MALSKVSDEWVPLQITVFTRWVNSQLKAINDSQIEDITKDLSSGVHLVQLARSLTHKEPEIAWKADPKYSMQEVENCDLAINMFKNDGVNIVGISGKDINDNNTKLILGLIWTLILYYSIGRSINDQKDSGDQGPDQSNKKSSKSILMDWAIERTSSYPHISNFQPYDLSMCALLDSYVPDKINYNSLTTDDTEQNVQLATDVMNELGIPVYIYKDDVVKSNNNIDDKTLLTQLASAKVVLDNLNTHQIQERGILLDDEKLKREAELDESQINDLKKEIENIKKDNLAEKNAIKCLKFEVRQLKKASNQITPTNDEADNVVHEQLRNALAEVQSKLQSLAFQVQESESNKADSSASNEDKDKAEIERLNNELSEIRSQFESLQNEKNSCKESIDSLRSELEKVKESNHELVIKERSVTLDEPNEKEQMKQEIQNFQSELQKLSNQVQESQNNQGSKEDVDKLVKERDEDKAEIQRLKIELTEVRSQFEGLLNEKNACKESIDSLKSELEKLKESPSQEPVVKERSVSLNNEADEHEQLRKDIQSLQDQLQKLNEKVQADGTKSYLFIFIILVALLVCMKLFK